MTKVESDSGLVAGIHREAFSSLFVYEVDVVGVGKWPYKKQN
jgi:hypothetical protein